MKNTAIIIPARLEAKRFPNKPLVKINNVPMILHVVNRAIESKVGEVYVATPDQDIINIVNGQEDRYLFKRLLSYLIKKENGYKPIEN